MKDRDVLAGLMRFMNIERDEAEHLAAPGGCSCGPEDGGFYRCPENPREIEAAAERRARAVANWLVAFGRGFPAPSPMQRAVRQMEDAIRKQILDSVDIFTRLEQVRASGQTTFNIMRSER